MLETRPSLTFVRPVANIDHVLLGALQDEFSDFTRKSGLSDNGVYFNFPKTDDYTMNIISGGELIGFHRENGLVYGPDEVEALANYLDQNLPKSIDDHIAIDTFPLTVYGEVGSRDFRAGAGDMLLEERNLVLGAIQGYYGVRGPLEERWPDTDKFTRLSIARMRYKKPAYVDRVGQAFSEFLTRATAILPEEILLDPLEINDTLSTRSYRDNPKTDLKQT